ncbi:hypothetical protein, conserved [Entamoeba dispar SAW760]|uniref:Major facilitator superfamily (MFS) profile domain-containing protein n=1 Tax=Entamoeba dispar (strain ATCC PRA-260 / SAW760) TaxID=370354 RepID=B0EH49_ENTDS|nr:uncharacterized protein EDI_313970 [Entamoeba dispar SAW760]EDR26146.1 hypothetical protein, conserved [Entamoeba dispar SAW760]|eukprot:EDR26146.1 hypothetical protein, conserved [Entamoeba dispar SAW760]
MSASENTHLVETTSAPSSDTQQQNVTQLTEAQSTNVWNVILWYFFEISYHFYNCIVNVTVGPSLQLLSIYAGYENSTGVQMTTVCNAVANCIAMVASPFVGGLSDYYSFRKGAVLICATTYYTCFLIAGVFYYHFWLLCILFCIARTSFELVRLFYDCQIPYIMDQKNRTLAQSVGGAVSFTGAILAIGVSFCCSLVWGNYSNVNQLQITHAEPDFGPLRQLILFNFFLGGYVFLPYVFSIEKSTPPAKRSVIQTLKVIGLDLIDSFKNYFKSRDCVFMFISWCCTLSALSVVNGLFVVLLTTMCGMKKTATDIVFLALNVTALLCGVPWAFFLHKFGPKRALQLMLILLFFGMGCLVLTGMKVSSTKILSQWIIIPTIIFIGPAFSVVYTASRQLVMELAPVQQLAQFSAVTRIAARAGGMVFPLIFSTIVKQLCAHAFSTSKYKYNYAYRIAQIPVFILLIVAFFFMCLVKNHHKEYVSGKRAPYSKETDIELADAELPSEQQNKEQEEGEDEKEEIPTLVE